MKVGILGCKGRMGSMLVQELRSASWPMMTLAGGTARQADRNAGFPVMENAADLFAHADALIDFTTPAGARAHAGLAAEHRKILVCGTTGLSAEDEHCLREAAEKTRIVYAANMSIGVNVLLAAVEQLAARLQGGWDIEIFEAHHKRKIDAPSGTALALGKAAARGRDVALEDVMAGARHGHTGPRAEGQIGFSVARGGDVVGDHTVFFYGEGERLELSHRASSRALFACGALRAALMVQERPNGLYSMRDLLGL